MSDLLGLNEIQFAERDAAVISAEIISRYEAAYREATGERISLAAADPRRLFLLTIADIIVQQRNIIDFAAKQNILAYAGGDHLDHLGALLGVRRLSARAATTTIRFTRSGGKGAVIVPAGTRVTASGTQIYFATDEDLVIEDGEAAGEISASCTAIGSAGSGFLPGQITRLVDPVAMIQGAANTTISEGGADVEGDENLRERIRLAPEGFSNAGSRGAYEYWTRTASQLIVDAAVHAPSAGRVDVYPLIKGGELPSDEILISVAEVLNADTIRPLTDLVTVKKPTPVEYDLEIKWWLDRVNSIGGSAIQSAVEAAVGEWVSWQRAKLGRDINPSELIKRVISAGAKRVDIVSPQFRALEFCEIATARSISVEFGGVEDG